jgi:aminopeptidase N
MAFDWAVANRDLVNSFVEASSQSGYIVGLGAGSSDPAMAGKISAYAAKYLDAGSRGGAERTLRLMAVRKATAARLRPATEAWLAAK